MKLFKKTDILIITVIIAAAMVIWLFYSNAVSGRPVRAEILLVRPRRNGGACARTTKDYYGPAG